MFFRMGNDEECSLIVQDAFAELGSTMRTIQGRRLIRLSNCLVTV